MRRYRTFAAILLFGAAFVLAQGAVAHETTTTMDMRNSTYIPETLTVEEGHNVTITLRNLDTFEHTFDLPEFGVSKSIAGSATETVTFVPDRSGTFQFWCTIPGHRQAGMEGTLTVGTVPPPTPGFDVAVALAAIAGAVLLVEFVHRRRRA